ncbi:Chain length determinant protein [Tranquillimonas alkanivorans]|uniref:Chain length determinant protein n=1 Tax=Tranquillimonas alkanivorans TaxID=441119 RepID=A0A1I5L878_9RHOB|nr:Chain length determinant protein [Tranquillimonas alkanivorans]
MSRDFPPPPLPVRAPLGLAEPAQAGRPLPRILWRQRLVLVLTVAAGLAAAAAYLFAFATPVHEARVALEYDPRDTAGVPRPVAGEELNAQAALLSARPLLARVAAAAGTGVTADDLSDWVFVRQAPLSRILWVSLRAPDADQAARLGNALAAAYLDAQVRRKRAERDDVRARQTGRVRELSEKLDRAETALAERRLAAGPGATQLPVVLRQRIRALDRQLAGTREAARREAIARRRARLEAQADRLLADHLAHRALAAEVETLRTAHARAATALRDLPSPSVPLRTDARVLSPATPPAAPIWPRPGFVFALSALLSASLGVLLALLRDRCAPPEAAARTLERATGLPVLAELPRARRFGPGVPPDLTALVTHVLTAGPSPVLAVAACTRPEDAARAAGAVARALSDSGRDVLVSGDAAGTNAGDDLVTLSPRRPRTPEEEAAWRADARGRHDVVLVVEPSPLAAGRESDRTLLAVRRATPVQEIVATVAAARAAPSGLIVIDGRD